MDAWILGNIKTYLITKKTTYWLIRAYCLLIARLKLRNFINWNRHIIIISITKTEKQPWKLSSIETFKIKENFSLCEKFLLTKTDWYTIATSLFIYIILIQYHSFISFVSIAFFFLLCRKSSSEILFSNLLTRIDSEFDTSW